jgi:hypothetical protein
MLKDILFTLVGLFALYFVGIPLFKLLNLWLYEVKDPLDSAQARLARARKEVAAAEVDKETEKVYQKMYQNEDESSSDEKGNKE